MGSASLDLLKQSPESLAGRIAYKELSGFNAAEVAPKEKHPQDRLWLPGRFPDSFLAKTDDASLRWRLNFISTCLERDVPQFGGRIPAVTLHRLWTMLAHNQNGQLNIAQLNDNINSLICVFSQIEQQMDIEWIRRVELDFLITYTSVDFSGLYTP